MRLFILLPGLVIALSFHEYAHAWVADYLGDDTPYYQGRLTVNPLAHIDWVGFFMLLFMHFGWAKPVNVNPLGFRKVGPKEGMMLVSLAGPCMNFILAIAAALLMKLVLLSSGPGQGEMWLMLIKPVMEFNVILGLFNLIPVPPLDGSKILAGIMPDKYAAYLYGMENYGTILLLVLILSGAIGRILLPLVNMVNGLLYTLVVL